MSKLILITIGHQDFVIKGKPSDIAKLTEIFSTAMAVEHCRYEGHLMIYRPSSIRNAQFAINLIDRNQIEIESAKATPRSAMKQIGG